MILQHWDTKEDIEITNGKELKEFLSVCNPMILKIYLSQLSVQKPDLKVENIGRGLKITRRENV